MTTEDETTIQQHHSHPILQFAHDLGLEEKDALFPLSSSFCTSSSKAKYTESNEDDDNDAVVPAKKKLKLDCSVMGNCPGLHRGS